ncbi:unnamed protein product, partial [Tetraodon nigroviridis]
NSHNQKVQMHMMDLMSSIIMEGDGVTQELLDTILINLIPAHKNLNKQAYDLAKTLLKRTVQTIETCIANSEANNAAMLGKLMSIAKNLPDAGKAQDFMKKFNQVLGEDEKLRLQLEMLISPTCSCKQAETCVREITRKLTFPKQPTNPFLEMVKFLLERIAPVHIDSEAIR